jgi:hypothetical protein
MKGNLESEKLSVLCLECCIYSDHVLRLYINTSGEKLLPRNPQRPIISISSYSLLTAVSITEMEQSERVILKKQEISQQTVASKAMGPNIMDDKELLAFWTLSIVWYSRN